MARHEADREDILREATALVERAELQFVGRSETVIVGFRSTGLASLFYGADPVYHFNAQNELRRAFFAGDLIKAERGRLVRLRRQRTADEVQLLRHEMSEQEQRAALRTLEALLTALRASIAAGEVRVVGAHPADIDILARIRTWLQRVPDSIRVADRPNVG